MIKKTLTIMVLSGLLLLPLSRCAKSDKLSAAEVNEIFNTLCLAINDALSQANSSAAATSGRVAENKRAAEVITYQVNWQGSGEFEGISLTGWFKADTESGVYEGNYSYRITLYDASTSLKNTVIINSGSGRAVFNGQASEFMQFHHSENHEDFNLIIGTTQYDAVVDYTLNAVGSTVTYGGTVILNGKEYTLSY